MHKTLKFDSFLLRIELERIRLRKLDESMEDPFGKKYMNEESRKENELAREIKQILSKAAADQRGD